MYDIEAAEERRRKNEEICPDTAFLDINTTCIKCGLTHKIADGHDCRPENLKRNLKKNFEKVKKESEGFPRKLRMNFYARYRRRVKEKYGVTL